MGLRTLSTSHRPAWITQSLQPKEATTLQSICLLVSRLTTVVYTSHHLLTFRSCQDVKRIWLPTGKMSILISTPYSEKTCSETGWRGVNTPGFVNGWTVKKKKKKDDIMTSDLSTLASVLTSSIARKPFSSVSQSIPPNFCMARY